VGALFVSWLCGPLWLRVLVVNSPRFRKGTKLHKDKFMKVGSIVIRCFEYKKMLDFWSAALHYIPKYPPSDNWVILTDPSGKGPNISLDKVPEKRTGKRGWLHLDLYSNDQKKDVERLISLGAVRYPWRYKPDDDFVVLRDPDDNLFCVIQE
jgi:hypothetical protein